MNKSTNRHKLSKSESYSMRLETQSKSQFMMRSGMRINTVAETMEHIKKQRVKSYQKISFSIRKMDDMFKPKQANPEETQFRMAMQQCQNMRNASQALAKNQKLKTCINFYDSIKFKKNIITQQSLTENEERGQRIKTEHFQESPNKSSNRKESFSNLLLSTKKSTLLPISTSILKSSFQEDQIITGKGIPGVQFKRKAIQSPKKVSTTAVSKTSTGSLKKSMEKLSTMTKKVSYLHIDELLERDADQRVEQMYELRRQQHLFDEPKQWQFYNCLKLSQLSLYRSNLKLSCENWVLLDYLELKYIRGWNPKEEKEMKVALTLFLTSIVMSLQSSGLDCQRLKIRINNSLIEKKVSIGIRNYPSLQNNTILTLWDLFVGVVYTNSMDLSWHLIFALAYLHKNYNVYMDGWSKDLKQYSKYIFIEDANQIPNFQKIFITLCEEISTRLKLSSFKIDKKYKNIGGKSLNKSIVLMAKSHQYMQIRGSCIQVAILFMQCIKFPCFLDIFTNSKSQIEINISYQVGFHYWQGRIHKWDREYGENNGNFFLIDKNMGNSEFGAISYNKILNVISIINDSKANMAVVDCESIQKWMKTSVRRFQSPRKRRQ